MIGNWELYGLTEAEMFFVLADANLEAAIVLANALRTGAYSQTFSHAKVIMSLHHHGVELFLKYALSRAGKNVPTHHHLRELGWCYSSAFTDPEFQFVPPFVAVYMGATPEQVHEALAEECDRKNRNKTDQEMRYHTDRDGNVWPGATGVLPDDYANTLVGLRDRIHVLHKLIEERVANKASDATQESTPSVNS